MRRNQQLAIKMVVLCATLVASNYLCIALGISDFDKAFERSFFQMIAIALAYWNARERPLFAND